MSFAPINTTESCRRDCVCKGKTCIKKKYGLRYLISEKGPVKIMNNAGPSISWPGWATFIYSKCFLVRGVSCPASSDVTNMRIRRLNIARRPTTWPGGTHFACQPYIRFPDIKQSLGLVRLFQTLVMWKPQISLNRRATYLYVLKKQYLTLSLCLSLTFIASWPFHAGKHLKRQSEL